MANWQALLQTVFLIPLYYGLLPGWSIATPWLLAETPYTYYQPSWWMVGSRFNN